MEREPLMKQKRIVAYVLVGAVALAAAGFFASRSFSTGEETVASLATETHFHGLSVDSSNPTRLYLATHHGFYVVSADGKARRLSESRDDFMGFTPHPADASILYASGHPAAGGNLGFIMSSDGGHSWRKISGGAGGPVDFHQMDVSKADPKVIYGVHGGIQKSTDGGKSWTIIGAAPQGLIDLAAGSIPDRLYAATQQGLLRSTDSGRSWKPAFTSRQPVTMIHATSGGELYAFVVGTGLIHADEQDLNWNVVGGSFSGHYLLHLAAGPGGNGRLYAVAFNPADRSQSLLTSTDGGKSWAALHAK